MNSDFEGAKSEDIEAALYGGDDSPAPDLSEPPPVSAEPAAPIVPPVEPPAEPVLVVPPVPAVPAEPPIIPPVEPVTAPAVAVPPVTPPAPAPPSNLSPIDARAFELKSRNPDMTLEDALARAKGEQEGSAPPPSAPDPVATLESEVNSIAEQLEEAGNAGGLFTADIAKLNRDFAQKSSQLAILKDRQQRDFDSRQHTLYSQQMESRDRVIADCPEAANPETEIGKAIGEAIDELDGSRALISPNAAETVFNLALERVAPETKTRILADIAAKKATANPPANPPAPISVIPSVVPPVTQHSGPALPVSPSARTSPTTPLITGPATLRSTLPTVDASTLEAALYGDPGTEEPVYRNRR